MGGSEEARLMLAAAKRDFNALRGMNDAEVFADEIFGFHAQQAAEKILKAWLSFLGVEYPRTHDLTRLVSLLQAHNQNVNQLDELIEFNPYAVQFRYDSFDDLGAPLDRAAVNFRIQNLYNFADDLITG